MSGTTYSKFFWQDWDSDPGLAQCSLAAQGLWMRMLCIASQSDAIGFVMIAGKAATPAQIAHHVRLPETAVTPLIEELEKCEVFSRDRLGVMFSRRMVSDAKKRRLTIKGGATAAALSTRNAQGKFQQPDTNSPATIYQSPESINHQPPLTPGGNAAAEALEGKGLLDKIEAASRIQADPNRRIAWMAQITAMRQQGIDVELDLIPVIVRSVSQYKVTPDLKSLRYFQGMALENMQKRLLAGAPKAGPTAEEWATIGRHLLLFGWWPREQAGPQPFEEGCRYPDLAALEVKWIEQGSHPLEIVYKDQGIDMKPRAFWGSNVAPIAAKSGGAHG
jgi:hypothetical protein